MSDGPLVVGFSKSTQIQFLVFKDGFSIISRVPLDSVAVETETAIRALSSSLLLSQLLHDGASPAEGARRSSSSYLQT